MTGRADWWQAAAAAAMTMMLPTTGGAVAGGGPRADEGAPTDWAAAVRQDAQAFHDGIAANHPGPVNRLDPGFERRNDAALALALRRARRVTDYAGYLSAMRGFTAAFDDGHLSLSTMTQVPIALRWPGFLTAYDERGRQIVRSRRDDAPVPLGARLVACDGRGAAALGRSIVGAFRGRWFLAAMRGREGYRVFVDNGNPFVARPRRCTFRIGAAMRTITLRWHPLSDADWTRYAAPLASGPPAPIAARTLADGTRWYAISDFDGDPSGDTARALTPMIAAMRRDRAAIVAAPRIVLDLRGNGGGSSDWSQQIAEVLWGRARIAALPADDSYVEWRASAANAASVAAYRDRFAAAPDTSDTIRRYFATAAAGIARAHAAGAPLWREPAGLGEPPPAAPGEAVTRPAARIYVLTDWACGSACLDAVDLWKALGAIQIGQETSADTLYMDLRQDPLPGGRIRANIPMKVYRGRARGSNVPQVPRYAYTGDMRETRALEAFVTTLPR